MYPTSFHDENPQDVADSQCNVVSPFLCNPNRVNSAKKQIAAKKLRSKLRTKHSLQIISITISENTVLENRVFVDGQYRGDVIDPYGVSMDCTRKGDRVRSRECKVSPDSRRSVHCPQ